MSAGRDLSAALDALARVANDPGEKAERRERARRALDAYYGDDMHLLIGAQSIADRLIRREHEPIGHERHLASGDLALAADADYEGWGRP